MGLGQKFTRPDKGEIDWETLKEEEEETASTFLSPYKCIKNLQQHFRLIIFYKRIFFKLIILVYF